MHLLGAVGMAADASNVTVRTLGPPSSLEKSRGEFNTGPLGAVSTGVRSITTTRAPRGAREGALDEPHADRRPGRHRRRRPRPAPGPGRPQPGVRATAGLVNHTWGVEVELHASGFDTGRRYRVAVLGPDGEPHPAGEFVGTGAREMDCT